MLVQKEVVKFYEEKVKKEILKEDLFIINLERLLSAIEKEIADMKDRKETTPYARIKKRANHLLETLQTEKRSIEREIEERLNRLAPVSTNLMGYRILAKMLSKSGSFKNLAMLHAGKLQLMGAERGLFSYEKNPKYGYIYQHPEIKRAEKKEKGKVARRLACRLAIALRKDFFSIEEYPCDETIELPRAGRDGRSKLFTLLSLERDLSEKMRGDVLYLGAGSGTTAKKLTEISKNLYCVELAPLPFSSLLSLAKRERNIFPIMEDANDPETYEDIKPDFLYQDITQKNQVEIFLKNMNFFSIDDGILMIKASSIDSRKDPAEVFKECKREIEDRGYNARIVVLSAYHKNHAALIISR
jgi:fibrillarin-like pre-rRNA processing protein